MNKNVIEQLYRGEWIDGQWVSYDNVPGGTAGAIRWENKHPNDPIGGKHHRPKGEQRLGQLKGILESGEYNGIALSARDMNVVRDIHDDLLFALQGK